MLKSDLWGARRKFQMLFRGLGAVFAIIFTVSMLPGATAVKSFMGADGSGPRRTWVSGQEQHQLAAPGASPLLLNHGTTTVAMVVDGGVIAAVDSRASMGGKYHSCSVPSAAQSHMRYSRNLADLHPRQSMCNNLQLQHHCLRLWLHLLQISC
jgi:hypothetical protein